LGYFWAITQLLDHYHPITAKDGNAVQLTGRHFIANIEPTEQRPDHSGGAASVISKVYGKQPDSLSLPHYPSEPGICLEDCYKAYYMTRSSVAVAAMWHDNTTTNIHKQINKYTDK